MNIVVTSREEIISTSKKIAVNGGLQAISIRAVAKECGVAVGSVYNYFDSKADLVSAVVEDVWKNVFKSTHMSYEFTSFTDYVEDFFTSAKKGTTEFPSFFNMHSMSFANDEKEKGRKVMNRFFIGIRSQLLASLESDNDVKHDAFNESFTKEDFIGFVFSNLLSMLMNPHSSCDTLIEIIRRTVY